MLAPPGSTRDLNYQTYHLGLRAFASLIFLGPVILAIDAPFGRFSLKYSNQGSLVSRVWNSLSINGTVAWIAMEIPSPICLLVAFSHLRPLTSLSPTSLTPHTLLPLLFVGHYLNRAVISPLRTPSRSKSHVSVWLAATLFSLVNGSVMGTWLGAGAKTGFVNWTNAPSTYYVGLAIFGLGLWGNIWHDEVLLDIRKPKAGEKEESEPKYAVPHGGLYSLVSFPNYLCEWFEWAGFALAAHSIITPLQTNLSISLPFSSTIILLTPPILFTLVEIAVMLPRAIRGHAWYHDKFEDYPKERRAAIPFVV
ncbi:hypothetical protein BDV93DRAFT_611291 [Ceratobasidium sp. AG-I]|nr:hypothetical protein BDV93DRAFT_611291 [Ceratobasidium sp. AG-I]